LTFFFFLQQGGVKKKKKALFKEGWCRGHFPSLGTKFLATQIPALMYHTIQEYSECWHAAYHSWCDFLVGSTAQLQFTQESCPRTSSKLEGCNQACAILIAHIQLNLSKDPLRKEQSINYLSTRDILKKSKISFSYNKFTTSKRGQHFNKGQNGSILYCFPIAISLGGFTVYYYSFPIFHKLLNNLVKMIP